jgi:hypothetical protein
MAQPMRRPQEADYRYPELFKVRAEPPYRDSWSKAAKEGKLWRMAPGSIDATVRIGRKPKVPVKEELLDALSDTITLRSFSVNIYSYFIQQPAGGEAE